MKQSIYFGIPLMFLAILSLFILAKENEKPQYHFDWSGIRKEIQDTLIVIDKFGHLDGYFRGYGGSSTRQYKRIAWFRKNVTVKEAELLAHYPSAPVKVLAFNFLLRVCCFSNISS